MSETHEYIVNDRDFEERRLLEQSVVLDPLTRRLFDAAGLEPGMRVLDLGSGAGNVARLAADIVGPEGSVIGVERDPDAVQRAQRLVDAAGYTNIEFREGDVQELDVVDGVFDAVVGRLVLLFLPDPAEALRRALPLLRPGGVLCMQEPDLTYSWTSVDSPLWRQVRGWVMDTLTAVGADMKMGLSLFATFREAGAPDPLLRMEAVAGGGANAPAFGWANVVEGILPLMERLGIAKTEEVEPKTLTTRLLAEIADENGTVVGPFLYGAWATK
ncbi:class I SAM-dependent methyltransferase [Saccharopolyspora sp. WRP15-2]|uniref:Class I SAM-dependent methyltransferase n=1 Tax=Saccharopolyspora oryzae TaxID=2997343 RepID=A0ABT4V0Y6_9PSEU|nr:class I SAM-dependent methyltransferase [Saccharopolyspora oryzae]MDA3626972.1 class I SAM-dependent methyltransferase [Saccharopolyspora oryzae]